MPLTALQARQRSTLGNLEQEFLQAMADSCQQALTPAEERVLAVLRRGQSNRSIAAELVLSPRTVEGHIANLLIKTGCRNRSQLLLWELARG